MAGKLSKVHTKKWTGVFIRESATRKYDGKPDGCYYITYKVCGKKKIEKIGWKSEGYTPQVAEELRAQRVKDARHGKAVKTANEIHRELLENNRPLNEIKEAYFNSERGLLLKGRTTDLNRYDLHLAATVGSKRISEITELDVQKIKQSMAEKAPATIRNALELLRRLINFGESCKLCPALGFTIKLPRVDNEVTEHLTQEEAARLMTVLNNWPSKEAPRMLKLALFTGMRRGEIFKLQTQDLNFLHDLICLRNPKGGRDASVPMSTIAKNILREQIEYRNKIYPDSDYIFPGKSGKMRTDSSAVKRIKKKAGLPKSFRIFHGLRHHLAVTLANSGEYTIDMIGELLTHKSAAMTKRYAKYLPDTTRKAANRAADLLQGHMEVNAKTIDIANAT